MIRIMAQAIAATERVLFLATTADPATIYFATSTDSGVDAGAAMKRALAMANGRGGGSGRMAQGTVADPAMLDAVLAELLRC